MVECIAPISRAPVVEFFVPAPVEIAATASASHGGPDTVPRSDVAGTGASAAAHGTDAADAAADATGKAVTAANHERFR